MKKMMMFMVTLLTVVLTAGCSNTTNSTLKTQETTTQEESTTLQNVKALPMLSKFLTGVTSSVSSEKESTEETTEEEIPFEDKEQVEKALKKRQGESSEEMAKEILPFRSKDAFQYKAFGCYYLSNWYLRVYSFEKPNNFYEAVMLDDDDSSVMLIHNTGTIGISFADVILTTKGKFYGLTNNHIIFQKSDKSLIAVPLGEPDTWRYDESNSLKFSELSGVERKTLIKPISSCRYNFSEPKNSEK